MKKVHKSFINLVIPFMQLNTFVTWWFKKWFKKQLLFSIIISHQFKETAFFTISSFILIQKS